jgi:hypothetical protein
MQNFHRRRILLQNLWKSRIQIGKNTLERQNYAAAKMAGQPLNSEGIMEEKFINILLLNKLIIL